MVDSWTSFQVVIEEAVMAAMRELQVVSSNSGMPTKRSEGMFTEGWWLEKFPPGKEWGKSKGVINPEV